MDYMQERSLNLSDINGLKHIKGEVYTYEGIELDMKGCGREQFQIMKHIAKELATKVHFQKAQLLNASARIGELEDRIETMKEDDYWMGINEDEMDY